MKSFPFNCARRLGREIVQDAVDALDFGDDALHDVLHQVEGDVLHGGGHGILGVDRTDDDGPLIAADAVAHADAPEIRDDGEVLPHLVLQVVLQELLAQDGVALADGFQAVPGDGAQAADSQAGAGEGLAVYHAEGQAQGHADDTHFILEEELQGLDELEVQVLGQAAHVVVRLDGAAFQDIGIDGALRQPAPET